MGGNMENNDLELTKLTLELFKSIFDKSEPEVHIDSFEEAHGSGRGDNYTAALYRVLLKGSVRNSDGKKLKWEKSVICKRLPDSRIMREAYKSVELFRNEVKFYNTIMPEMQRFQKTKSIDIFRAIPQCYIARDDLLILEDLQVRDFKMPDRRKGLHVNEMTCVLEQLAHLHALSLAHRNQHPVEFEKMKNEIDEGIFSDSNFDWYDNYYKNLTESAMEMVASKLPPHSKYINKMKKFTEKDKFFGMMVDLVTRESPLAVICHGDCWTNNFMYRCNELGEVQEVCLLDFQLIRYGSLALDIANLIFCCTDKKLRDHHMDVLLKVYHTKLVKCLEALGGIPPFCGADKDELWIKIRDEFKLYGKFGLGLALDILPMSTCSSEDAPDLYIENTSEAHGAPELKMEPNEICRQKMADIVVDLVDAGML